MLNLIENFSTTAISETNIISWSSPIPAFGNPQLATIATLGLNPSNREFVDESGKELIGTCRRFQTLRSLGLGSWQEADETHANRVLADCRDYFVRNPYDTWFKKLDYLLSGVSASYYPPAGDACHLDLIPYATERKWTMLTRRQRELLRSVSGDSLANTLKNSPIRAIILNGQGVIDQFELLAKLRLARVHMPLWTLPRRTGAGVSGFAYTGVLSRLGEFELGRKVRILGYNHNLQSSFGVTKTVINAIRDWISSDLR